MDHRLDIGKSQRAAHDVTQTEFSVAVAGECVPGVIWAPDGVVESRILIAMGHGGSQHKKARTIRDRAIRYASVFGWASLAIDAPGHGDRITPKRAEEERRKARARVTGEVNAPALSPEDKIEFLDALAEQAVPEWQAALDVTLLDLAPNVESIGYLGVSQGTWIGVPLLATDNRFSCAVLGLSQLAPGHVAFRVAAERITIPLRFAFQWDDAIRDREYGVALFRALGSADKSMHINSGGHEAIPTTESESWDDFFQRHLEQTRKVAKDKAVVSIDTRRRRD